MLRAQAFPIDDPSGQHYALTGFAVIRDGAPSKRKSVSRRNLFEACTTAPTRTILLPLRVNLTASYATDSPLEIFEIIFH